MKKLILVVTGGRYLDDLDLVLNQVVNLLEDEGKSFSSIEFWHGDASGIDLAFDATAFLLGAKTKFMSEDEALSFSEEEYAIKVFQPDWRIGAKAGPKRNRWMMEKALLAESLGHTVYLLAFPGGRGTKNCVEEAQKREIIIKDFSSLTSPTLEKIKWTESLSSEEDGISHLNVYSQAKTDLGKFLSNFTRISPLETPYGKFISLEGYYFYLSSLPLKESNMSGSLEKLKTLASFEAKKLGSDLANISWNSEEMRNSSFRLSEEDFRNEFSQALKNKILASSNFKSTFIKNELPFCHYYNYHGKTVVGAGQWIILALEKIKSELI